MDIPEWLAKPVMNCMVKNKTTEWVTIFASNAVFQISYINYRAVASSNLFRIIVSLTSE